MFSLQFLLFLEGMARDDQERCAKYRQDVSGSSRRAPTAKSKKLAKGPRPISYQEESSPEASPPRGGTPDETECLMMYSQEVHTNWEVMKYNKEDPMNVMHLRNKPGYSLPKERAMMTGHSFIKIGTRLCFTKRHLWWSNISGLTLII
jgi:hypothetical protein